MPCVLLLGCKPHVPNLLINVLANPLWTCGLLSLLASLSALLLRLLNGVHLICWQHWRLLLFYDLYIMILVSCGITGKLITSLVWESSSPNMENKGKSADRSRMWLWIMECAGDTQIVRELLRDPIIHRPEGPASTTGSIRQSPWQPYLEI